MRNFLPRRGLHSLTDVAARNAAKNTARDNRVKCRRVHEEDTPGEAATITNRNGAEIIEAR